MCVIRSTLSLSTSFSVVRGGLKSRLKEAQLAVMNREVRRRIDAGRFLIMVVPVLSLALRSLVSG